MRCEIKLFFWLIALLFPLLANAQFNPDNPPEPGSYRLITVASPSEGGWTDPSSTSLRPGAKVTLSCSPYSDYAFDCWRDEEGNVVSTEKEWVLTMPRKDVKYTAVFKFKPWNPDEPSTPVRYSDLTVECDPAEGGNVYGTGRFEVGTTVQLNAYNNSGYKFVNWTKDGAYFSDSKNIDCVIADGSNHYVAHFDFSPGNPDEPSPVNSHRLYLKSNPEGTASFSVSSGTKYENGKSINLDVYPSAGWSFVNWTDEAGNEVSTSKKFTYTMPDRKVSLTANLKFKPTNPDEPGTPTATRDIIYGDREVIMPGRSTVFSISLENFSEIAGLNVDITRPDGVILDIDGATLTSRSNGHTLTMEKIDDNTTRLYIRGSQPFAGVNGPVIRMMATAPDDAEVGSKIPVKLTKGVAFAADGSGWSVNAIEGTLQVIALPETLPDSPDFIVTSLSIEEAEIMPGDAVSLQWSVENVGKIAANSGWSELVFLCDKDGRRVSLGTLHYDTMDMAPGEKIARSATFTVPDLPGVSGKLNVGVTIIPNAISGEIEEMQLNNTTITNHQPITLGKRLRLELPCTLAEGTDGVVRGHISRSGSWENDETFALKVTPEDSRLAMPATVTIPANQSATYFSATFSDNDVLDFNTQVTVAAEGNGYDAAIAEMQLVDDEFPEIVLSLSKNEIMEGDTVELTVGLPYTVSADTEVKLSCDAAQRINLPKSVVVKTGNSSVTVEIIAPDNKKIDGDTDITIIASAPHYEDGETDLTVFDDDIPKIELTLTPSEISEGDGPAAILARLVRTNNFDSNVNIELTDDSNYELIYPSDRIKMAAGQESVEFPVGVKDNNIVEGNREVNVKAAVYISSCGCSASGTNGGVVSQKITIFDNDGPTLTLYSSQSTIPEGGNGISMTVTRNTDVSEPLQVSLSSDADDILEYPASVIIPAGATGSTFLVKAKKNDITGDERIVNISAMADGFTKGLFCAMVTDTSLPDARITDISLPADHFKIGEKEVEVSMTLANTGSVDLPEMVKTTIYLDNKPSGYVYNQTPLKAGEKVALTKKIFLPSDIGEFKVYATVNAKKEVQELVYTNNSSSIITSFMTSPFTATASVDKKIYMPEEEVTVKGQIAGDSIDGKEVEVYVINSGVRQTLSAFTDANGTFTTAFKPYKMQMGHFAVGVCYPKENLTVETAGFDILGMKLESNSAITCDFYLGEKYHGEIGILNPGMVGLTGLKAEVVSLPENCDVKLDIPSELESNGKVNLNFDLTASDLTVGNDWQQVKINISSAEGVSLPLTIYYYVRSSRGYIVSDLSEINANISWDEVTEYPFVIRNIGSGATGKITLALPDWMDTATPREISSLAPSDSTTIVLHLKTNDKMSLNMPVTGQFGINCANGTGLAIGYKIVPVTERVGTVVFEACDEYTYNTQEAPKVAGASVKIFSPSTGETLRELTTGPDGTVSVELKGGYYRCEVTAEKHDVYSSYFFVSPGNTQTVTADISYNPITIDWNVVETEVEDEYSIETVVNYETNVPMPVVKIIAPKSIDGDNMAVGDATMITMTLHNIGLIKALDVNVVFEKDNPEWKFEPLAYTEPFDLDPQQSVNVPIRITRIADSSQKPHNVKSNSPAETMFDSYRGCMTHLGETYKVICGKKIKENEAAENMAMKMCATAATMAGIMDGLSNLFPGGGGIGGPSLGGGGGGSNGVSSNYGEPTLSFSICDPCDAEKAEKVIDTLVGKSWLGPFWDLINKVLEKYRKQGKNVVAVRRDLSKEMRDKAIEAARNGTKYLLPEEAGDFVDVAYDIIEITMPCDEDENKGKDGKRALVIHESKHSWMDDFNKVASMFADEILTVDEILKMFLGDEVWYSEMDEEKADYMDWVMELPVGSIVTEEDVIRRRPSSVTLVQALDFVNRMTGVLDDLTVDEVDDKFNSFENTENIAVENGYTNMVAYYSDAFDDYRNHFEEMKSSSVCASISLKISQKMTMTRQAFEGTLKVFNGHETDAMKDVRLNLVIRDEYGNIASSHEFETLPKSLEGFKGSVELPGDWTLDAGATGVATITFIPTRYAAPEKSRVYSFGGSITYVDPFTNLEVTRTLYPVELTVNPSPILDLTYFMQRDVYGDDPLTSDVVERISPAEFALVINNKGYGDADNVRLVTQQPQIIDNEKGLDIDFEFVSSQLNGDEATLAMGSEIASDFGTIPANSAAYAQWWLQSSLLGHFVDYDVNATHVTSYGNPDLTLLDKVEIHELIHGFTPGGSGDEKAIRAFLVNDIKDAEDAPDMVYFSDGKAESSVAISQSVKMIKVSDMEYEVTVEPSSSGWNYGFVNDLAAGKDLVNVVRKDDGLNVNLDNFWQTEVTLRDGVTPLHEKKLHLVADVDKKTTFVLTFMPSPDVTLDVESFSGIPDQETTLNAQLEKISVTFNKSIDESSFTPEDLKLTLMGQEVDCSNVQITPVKDREFNIDFGKSTRNSGYYVLTLKMSDVFDTEGYSGKQDRVVSWSQYVDTGVDMIQNQCSIKIYPLPLMDKMTVDGNFSLIKEMSVVDLSGQVMTQWYNLPVGTTVDIKHLSKGIYFIYVTTDNGVYVTKVLKR